MERLSSVEATATTVAILIALVVLSGCGSSSGGAAPGDIGADAADNGGSGGSGGSMIEAGPDAGQVDGSLLVDVATDATIGVTTPEDAPTPDGDSADNDTGTTGGDADSDAATYDPDRFVTKVVSFTPGSGAGFGQNRFPQIVYGPPRGVATGCMGSTDVLSLGTAGEIVVEFENNAVVDGPGPDFIVFENPFVAGCSDPSKVYAELGEVSVSDNGTDWVTFPCTATAYPFGTCAGWHPVYSSPNDGISPLDPAIAGGDAFDLAAVGVTHAKYVRVRDMQTGRDPGGFDLDAMAIVNAEAP